MNNETTKRDNDWSGQIMGFVVAWGLPILAMLIAIGIEPVLKTFIWLSALAWMGGACLMNARRCGRTHCFFTGPFFIIMMLPVALHGFAIIPFGPDGWQWLGMALGIGGGGLWCLTEAIMGRYRRS